MYIDDYGNEFKTIEEVKYYAIQNLYKDNAEFINALEDFVTSIELLNWIAKNPTVFEKFKEDYATIIRIAENDYAKDYLSLYCEEVKD